MVEFNDKEHELIEELVKEEKLRYYMQDLNNYTREHLINIIIFLEGELKKHEEKEDE